MGVPVGVLEAFGDELVASGDVLGAFWRRLGGVLEASGDVVGGVLVCAGVSGASWRHLGDPKNNPNIDSKIDSKSDPKATQNRPQNGSKIDPKMGSKMGSNRVPKVAILCEREATNRKPV